ncbi:hypothetical protein NMY22_g13917 [Coprinellus aureogranulatus]|nr:hypothetical protein NMY22_g13917 [Coprinellus aureogranulatus]
MQRIDINPNHYSSAAEWLEALRSSFIFSPASESIIRSRVTLSGRAAFREKAVQRIAELAAEFQALSRTFAGVHSDHAERLRCEIRALKRSINMKATVTGHLPPEILANIFLAYSSSCLTGPEQPRYPWIRVTHVCRHWRTVALDCSSMWSTIVSARPDLVDVLLQRSRGTPLSVDLDVSGGRQRFWVYTSLRGIYSQGNRLRVFEFKDFSGAPHPEFVLRFPAAVPLLEKLILVGVRSVLSRFPSRNILPHGAPRLKELELADCGVPWQDRVLQAPLLTKLCVSNNFARPPREAHTMDLFIKTMEGMPLLQEVSIHYSLPVGNSPRPRIQLLALETLMLVDEVSTVTGFLRLFENLGAKIVRLQTQDEVVLSSEPVQEMLAVLASRWAISPSGSAPKFQAVHHSFYQARLLLCAWLELRPETPQNFIMSVDAPQAFIHDNIMAAFIEHFDMSSTLRVLFSSNVYAPTRLLSDWIAPLKTVEKIVVVDVFATSLINVLEGATTAPSRSHAPTDNTPFFSSLAAIQVQKFNFNSSNGGNMDKTRRLARILQNWPETHPLRELRIVDCTNFTAGDRDLLQRELPRMTVIWDEKLNVVPCEFHDSEGDNGSSEPDEEEEQEGDENYSGPDEEEESSEYGD